MVSFLSVIAISNLVVSSLARPLTGGDIGLSPIDGIFSSIGLALSLAALVCVVGFLYTRYLKSKSGRILDFAREDQSIVRAAGADPHRYTGMLLLLSAIAGALGGALYVHYSGAAVVSNTFALGFMIRIVVMAIIGGRFSLRGSILGAYLVIFITMVLMPYVDAYVQFLVIYALGFVIYFFMPRGLVSLVDIVGSRVPWLQHPSRRRKETIADSSTGEG
jgi:ABC-type branched-subunit amino acid transport system permease subunit